MKFIWKIRGNTTFVVACVPTGCGGVGVTGVSVVTEHQHSFIFNEADPIFVIFEV